MRHGGDRKTKKVFSHKALSYLRPCLFTCLYFPEQSTLGQRLHPRPSSVSVSLCLSPWGVDVKRVTQNHHHQEFTGTYWLQLKTRTQWGHKEFLPVLLWILIFLFLPICQFPSVSQPCQWKWVCSSPSLCEYHVHNPRINPLSAHEI